MTAGEQQDLQELPKMTSSLIKCIICLSRNELKSKKIQRSKPKSLNLTSRSHGDRSSAARGGQIGHLWADERRRAAHAGLGSAL